MRSLRTIALRVVTDPSKLSNMSLAPLAQSIAFWTGVWLFRDQGVSMTAWAVLYVSCVSATYGLRHAHFALYSRFQPQQLQPGSWLLIAVNSVLVAALFWGANQGL